MGTNPTDPAQLEQELRAEQAAAEAAVEAAGAEAQAAAEKAGLSPDEVNKRVEQARKEEKDKLYPQLQALRDSVKEIQEVLRAEREEKERIKREAEEAKERQRQAKLSSDERQLEAIARIEEQLKKERSEREEMQRQLAEEKSKAKLEIYRQRVIQAANGELIPELVRGNTEAEIDESVRIAKARYEEIVGQVRGARGNEVKSNLSRTSANPDTAALEEQDYQELTTSLDMDKYMKDPAYRERIQEEMARAYESMGGRR